MQQLLRPSIRINQATKEFPGIWKRIDLLKQAVGNTFKWPEWCFFPANIQISPEGTEDEDVNLEVPFLAAWRASQGVYRFDPAVFDSLWDTPVNGEIPADVLKRLPEWCVYIETNDRTINIGGRSVRLYGFFVCLNFNVGEELSDDVVFLLDTEWEYLHSFIFPTQLAPGVFATIEEMIALYMDEEGNAFYPRDPGLWSSFPQIGEEYKALLSDLLPHLFALTLYLCSVNAEFRGREGGPDEKPKRPAPKKTKDGLRYFPPDRPTVWETAWRIGAAIRTHQTHSELSDIYHSTETKRPHIRRAHWHTFLAGPRNGKRDVRIKWLPPIPVNVDSPDDLIPAVRAVE